MQIKESAENYLETILTLKQQFGFVRSVDVANAMHFSKPSVSVAMKRLRAEGLIIIEENGGIVFTEKGLSIASRIYEKHKIIAEALMRLGVDEETAYADSCRIEHAISDVSFEKIKEHLLKFSE